MFIIYNLHTILLEFISKDYLKDMLYLLLAKLLNQLRPPAIDLKQYVLQRSLFTCSHERLNVSAEIAMQLLFSVLMNGRTLSYSWIIGDLSHPRVIQHKSS